MTSRCAAKACLAALAILLFVGKGAAAQGVPRTTDNAPPSLEFGLDLFGGWEADLADALVDPITLQPVGGTSGGLGGADLTLGTGLQGEHVGLSFAGNASALWLPSGALDDVVPGYEGIMRVGSVNDNRRTTWSVSQLLSYAPLNAQSLFAEGIATTSFVDYRISSVRSFRSLTSSGLGFRVSRRGQILLRAGYEIIEGSAQDAFGDSRRWDAGARYTHNLTRHLDVYGGYSHFVSDYGSPTAEGDLTLPQPAIGTIEAGVNYARALSLSRRTSLSFQTGSSAVDYGDTTQYNIIGNVSLDHQIGRTWEVQGSYERRVGFIDVFAEPAVQDMVGVEITGRPSRRTAIELLGSYSEGSLGQGSVGNNLDSAWASLVFRRGLGERFAFFSQYYYFQSEFGPLVYLPGSLGREQRRHGVRVGMSMGTTLLGPSR